MFRVIRSSLHNQKLPLSVALLIQPYNQIKSGLLSRSHHILSMRLQQNPIGGSITSSSSSSGSTILTSTIIPQMTQNCGLKIVGKVHRRCKDCRMMIVNGVIFNHCKTHPRHKQRQRLTRENNTWILTAVQQTKKRSWWMTINSKEINNVQGILDVTFSWINFALFE